MKRYFFFLLIPLVIFSCKKEESNTPASPVQDNVPSIDFLNENDDQEWFLIDGRTLGCILSTQYDFEYQEVNYEQGVYFLKSNLTFDTIWIKQISDEAYAPRADLLYQNNQEFVFRLYYSNDYKIYRTENAGFTWDVYWEEKDNFKTRMPLYYKENGDMLFVESDDFKMTFYIVENGIWRYGGVVMDYEMVDYDEFDGTIVFIVKNEWDNRNSYNKDRRYFMTLNTENFVNTIEYISPDELGSITVISRDYIAIEKSDRSGYLLSNNKGKTWVAKNNLPFYNFEKLFFKRAEGVYDPYKDLVEIHGVFDYGYQNPDAPNFYRSVNGGNSWGLVGTMNFNLHSNSRMRNFDNKFVILYGPGSVYYSDDYGKNWRQLLKYTSPYNY